MNGMNKTIYISGMVVFVLMLNGCKTNSSMMHCPDFASTKKVHTPVFAFNHNPKHKPVAVATQTAMADTTTHKTGLTAATDQEMHFKIRMPETLQKQMQDDQDLNDMNKLLANYSNNKVSLQRNDNGKLYLKAHAIKDIFALAKNTSHPRGYYERRYGNGGSGDAGGAAIAASVLGPVSFIFAFIPFLSFAAIPIAIAAIITGAIGLRSHRHRLAAIGLTFGILGLIFSLLLSVIYIHVFFFFWV
jgi:hypothetical protein